MRLQVGRPDGRHEVLADSDARCLRQFAGATPTSFLFGISAMAALTKARWPLVLPLAALLLDFAENGTIVGLLLRYPAQAPILAGLEGLLSGLKFTAYGLVALSVLVLLMGRAFNTPRTVEAP